MCCLRIRGTEWNVQREWVRERERERERTRMRERESAKDPLTKHSTNQNNNDWSRKMVEGKWIYIATGLCKRQYEMSMYAGGGSSLRSPSIKP